MTSPSSLVFKVQRKQPELLPPAKPTPRELKPLSDIDDQEGLRFQIPTIQFYHYDPSMKGRDCVEVIRDAVSKTLVYYYPLAGRLRDGDGRKLMVDCTGEGVVFIEADADVTLEQFGDALQPPFPCLEELLYDVPGSDGILNCPLLLIQVTRLKCGGFIFALRLNHTISDAAGLVQFLTAVGEAARGIHIPSTLPVWEREQAFKTRDPPRLTRPHPEYDQIPDTYGTLISHDDVMAQRSFFFTSQEIANLRALLPVHLRTCSTIAILTAALWRCRTISLEPKEPEKHEVRVVYIVNTRPKLLESPLPNGYYGNAIAFPMAVATAAKLCQNPLGFAVELVRSAGAHVTEEYMNSLADFMVMKGRPHITVASSFLVSDVTRAGFRDVDFGWGKAAYGGPAKGGVGPIPGLASFYVPFKDRNGEDGIVVPICLPVPAMERFVKELEGLLKGSVVDQLAPKNYSTANINSAL